MKNTRNKFSKGTYLFYALAAFLFSPCLLMAQKKLPVIKAGTEKTTLFDGSNLSISWKLNPSLKPDIYYVNIPQGKSTVTLQTDQESISFNSKYGKTFDFIVLLNEKDSCHIQFSATEEPTAIQLFSEKELPASIPFEIIGSRIYLTGKLNNDKEVKIQFDLGAGTSCVNKNRSDKTGLSFTATTLVTNTQGTNESRTSTNNQLKIGDFIWDKISFTEVANMQSHEDLIIGNSLFRDKIIEIDYDQQVLIIHQRLPRKAKSYIKQPVFYEQHRPKFEVFFTHEDKLYSTWFLFDTGREGTMVIGRDFTQQKKNWKELEALEIINGRKIIRIDAMIGGIKFTDIVTNAADPSLSSSTPTLAGNQLLSKFNVILDNKSGYLYLKENSRKETPYSNYAGYQTELKNRQSK